MEPQGSEQAVGESVHGVERLGDPEPHDDDALTGADDSFGLGLSGSWSLSGELPAGANLGGFSIVRLVADGGMGRVYEARQEAPRRTVAIKVIREGLVSTAAAERLLREAETLAMLRHPHIAQIHTFGTAPAAYGGVPFFVMEMVDGARPITRFAAARAVSIRARVALFRKVCEAVGHGHRHGVVHRDVKPANILVDVAGEPKLIDFGIALGADAAATSRQDGCGASGAVERGVVGTLRYMSPEQVLAPETAPDARSDVYALGLVLHELVTGRLPYDLAGKTISEAARILRSHAAPATAPVERAAGAEERRDDARALAVIVAKCLEPESADRYATAGDVAADLGRWLDGDAILARPPTPLESVRRLARRHRLAVAALAGLMATLIAAVVVVSLLSVRLERQRRVAEVAGRRAVSEATAASRQLYASTVLLAAAARDRDNLADAERLLGQASTLAANMDASPGTTRPIELDCLAASLDDALAVLPVTNGTVTALAWSPDGRWLVSGDREGVVRLHAANSNGDGASRTLAAKDAVIWSVAFSPDGRRLAAATGDGAVAIYEVDSGRLATTLVGPRGAVYAVAFAPDGRSVATASRDRMVRLWDAATGRETRVLRGHDGTVYAVAFSPDGETLATGSHDGTVRVWDADTGRLQSTLHGHGDRVFDVAFAVDGRRLASGSEDGTVRLWDASKGVETGCLRHPTRVNAIAFSAGADRIATAAADGLVRIWDVERGAEVVHLRGHVSAVWSVAWRPGDDRVATGAADGTVRIWDPAGRPDVLPLDARVLSCAFSPDGRTVALGTDDAEVCLADVATFTTRSRLGPAMGRVNGVAWSPDGALVAGACDDGALFVWDVASRERVMAAEAHAKRIYSVAFSPDGTRLATAAEDRAVALRDPRTGAVVGPTLAHPRRVFCAAFTSDGTRVATACEDRLVRVWDAATGAEVMRLAGHEGPVNWLAFSPDGDRIATASSDGTVRLWATADGSVEQVLSGPASQVWKVAFSADGSRAVAVSADGAVHLWDAATGRPAATLRGHGDQAWGIAVAPDGRSLVSGSWDGTARLWGTAPAEIARRRLASAR